MRPWKQGPGPRGRGYRFEFVNTSHWVRPNMFTEHSSSGEFTESSLIKFMFSGWVLHYEEFKD